MTLKDAMNAVRDKRGGNAWIGPERRGVPTVRVDVPSDEYGETTFKEILQRSVYGCGRSLKSVAADLDLSGPELSRRLADNPNDPIHFPAHLLPALMLATQDLSPLYWLIHKFLIPREDEKVRLLKRLQTVLPEIEKLVTLLKDGEESGE